MRRIIIDGIVFSIQRNGGISVVWYDLLNRLKDDNDFRLCYIDNKNLHNQFRNMLDIPAISKSDRYPPISYFSLWTSRTMIISYFTHLIIGIVQTKRQ